MSARSFEGETGTMYLRNIPRNVHAQFRAACAARGKNLNWMIVKLMKQYIKEHLGKVHAENKPRKKRRKNIDELLELVK